MFPPLRYAYFEVETDADGRPIRLGPGSMGATYRARDTHLRRPVALKVIDQRLLANPDSRRRFFNEARRAAQLEHPHIARVLYLSPEDDRTCFFVMELVEGETLSARVVRQGPCTAPEALLLLRQVVEALICLGQHRVIHRDIKPDNVVIGSDPRGKVRVKLIDFGLAKGIDSEPSFIEPVDTGSNFLGSSAYASPEQVQGNIALDQRSDFYSLGATLWHALTGGPPFGGSMFEVHEGHVRRDPPWARLAGQPESVLTLLRKLLAKERAHRPADARELARLWDEAAAHCEAAPSVAQEGAPPPPPRLLSRASAAPTIPEPEASVPAEPPFWKFAEGVPPGCSAPSLAGRLAQGVEGSPWYFVRDLPPALPEAAREALLAAARAATVASEVLFTVREIRDGKIVSDWAPGAHLAHVLSLRGAPLPADLVFSWLPRVARMVDLCGENGLHGLSLRLADWWIEFQDPALSPLEAATRPNGKWPAHRLRLDPLAAFDPLLEAVVVNLDGAAPPTVLRFVGGGEDPLPHLARAVHHLLSGPGSSAPATPLPIRALTKAQNRLLFATMNGELAPARALVWATAFACGGKLPLRAATPPAHRVAKREARDSTPQVQDKARGRPRSPMLYAAVLGLTVLGVFLAQRHRPLPGNDRPEAPPLETTTPASPGGAEPQAAEPAASRSDAVQNAATPARPLPASPTPIPSSGPPPPADWVNSLGMRFKRCAMKGFDREKSLLVSVWETRVQDYRAFLVETGRAETSGTTAIKDPRLPVTMVSWNEARDFCAWLTAREINAGLIEPLQQYRLPADHEWSNLVGIAGLGLEKPHFAISDKNGAISGRYPWGLAWPPPPRTGNFADAAYHRSVTNAPWIQGYDDGFAGPAPVGSFPPDQFGLFDIAGNVAEWCLDPSDSIPGSYVYRGGSYAHAEKSVLCASTRGSASPNARFNDLGFRVVLARIYR